MKYPFNPEPVAYAEAAGIMRLYVVGGNVMSGAPQWVRDIHQAIIDAVTGDKEYICPVMEEALYIVASAEMEADDSWINNLLRAALREDDKDSMYVLRWFESADENDEEYFQDAVRPNISITRMMMDAYHSFKLRVAGEVLNGLRVIVSSNRKQLKSEVK